MKLDVVGLFTLSEGRGWQGWDEGWLLSDYSRVHRLCLWTLKPSNDSHGYEVLGISLLLAVDVKEGTGAQSQSESCRSLPPSLFLPFPPARSCLQSFVLSWEHGPTPALLLDLSQGGYKFLLLPLLSCSHQAPARITAVYCASLSLLLCSASGH